jgi:predicted acyltransferase
MCASTTLVDDRRPIQPARTSRVASVDAYRGLVMLLLLAEVLQTCAVSSGLPGSTFWGTLCYEQTHAAWVGASLHDLIQPGFYFLVGVSLLFSTLRRREAGEPTASLLRHVAWRSLVLIVLGMALQSAHPRRWLWTFFDTLTQIGLAYPFAFAVALLPRKYWGWSLGVILLGYWLAFALYPAPEPGFDYTAVGVSPEWFSAHGLSGFSSHWQKNANLAAAVDRWLLNLFPRQATYVGDITGLTTLNFVPSIGTMILGLFAGDALRKSGAASEKFRWLVLTGIGLLVSGWTLGALGICPVVKAIWTPSWVIFSGGWCFLFLAAFIAVIDIAGFRAAAFPLIVIGTNSTVAYCISHLYTALAFNSIARVVGRGPFRLAGQPYEPLLYGLTILCIYWLFLYVLYRRKIFVRV